MKEKTKWPPTPNRWFEWLPEEPVQTLSDSELALVKEKNERFCNDLHTFRSNQPEWWELNMKTYSPTQLEYDASKSLDKCQENCKALINKPGRKVKGMVDRLQILAGIRK